MTEQLQLDFEKILKTSDISQNEVDTKRSYLNKIFLFLYLFEINLNFLQYYQNLFVIVLSFN